MPDTSAPIDPRREWVRHLGRIGSDHGLFSRLDARHFALMVEEESDTLLVSFDRADGLWSKGAEGLPLGFDAVPAHDVSLLSLMSVGRTWFRSDEVEAMLTGLAADGFFASFKHIILLASGPDCGHAAARAAVHMPGARVLLSRPAAAISARHAPFETRFRADRRADPDTPQPLGPEALESAAQVTILFDPRDPSDAAQAALFRGPQTTRIGFSLAGDALSEAFKQPEALVPLTRHLMRGTLDRKAARAALRPVLHAHPIYRETLSTRR
ncbi:hypothetical protein [Gymnodinialimonas hymeniacidonis]|uniref:hypothetical protein n=1 Tax=Gymnodinialimonas hymeniacidonis TaxID=3126508 RepID=UPI0034C60080